MGLLSQLRRFRTRVGNVMASSPGLVYVFLLIVFLELEESAQRAPTIRLLENAICLQYYRDHSAAGVVGDVDESMCKTPSIQSKLARTRGVLSLVDAVPVILLGSFYGSMADRKGRRFPFALAIFGIICQMASIYFICHLWDRLPVETVWLSSVFRLIGGGPNLAIALCLTMASDFSTEETRSKSFYRVFAASLFTDMISPSIAFATLRHSLWLPYLICALSLLCTYPVLLYMPEPLSKPSRNIEPNTAERTGLTAYFKFLKDWRILVGVVTVFLAQFRQNTLEILLPYASVRFHLELSKTATLLSVVSAVNIVVFLLVLPAVTDYLNKRLRISAHRVNIYVARISSATLAIGAAALAAASNIGLVVAALIIYATGFGVRLSILAVVTGFVSSKEETARLYTLIATTDALAHMIASPLLQWIWGRSIHLGGRWIVLPFLVLMCVFLLAFATSCFLEEPESSDQDDNSSGEQEALLGSADEGNRAEESLAYTA